MLDTEHWRWPTQCCQVWLRFRKVDPSYCGVKSALVSNTRPSFRQTLAPGKRRAGSDRFWRFTHRRSGTTPKVGFIEGHGRAKTFVLHRSEAAWLVMLFSHSCWPSLLSTQPVCECLLVNVRKFTVNQLQLYNIKWKLVTVLTPVMMAELVLNHRT